MTGNKPTEEKTPFSKLLIVALLFFLSGASSLIYQVIWTRQMVFVFGSSTFASATVLSAFMGGLALGSFVAGKIADKFKNPFLLYGILEGIIGIWAFAAPYMFDAALPIYKAFWQSLHLQILPFSLLRFVVVALILLVPTACMGATLPLLSRFITNSLNVVGARVGALYSINTLGAVAGATACGFFLIPQFGLRASTYTAALTNIALMVIVLVLSRFWPSLQVQEAKSWEPTPEPEPLSKPALMMLIAFGLSGAIAMIYEVAWTRSLLLIIGSTTYAFSIMLSTFLIGIFVGSFLMSRFADHVKNPSLWFAQLQILLGGMGIVSLFLFNYLPYWNIIANSNSFANPSVGMSVRFMLAGSIMVPIAILLGATFPLAVKTCARELNRLGNSVGTLYSVNTLGAIFGSFLAGFVIIPFLGGEQTLVDCALANALIGIFVLLSSVEGKMPLKAVGCIATGALAVWALGQPKPWNLHLITSSQKLRRTMSFTNTKEVPEFSKWADQIKSAFDILFWKDGICANVAIVKFKDQQISLFTNGHIDASDGPSDMPTQALLPSIPLLLKPDAKDIADVGWGSGCTMGYALMFPEIKNMVCAEIEPAVVETSQYFHNVNLAPELDPRLRIGYNDGRNYLLATDEKFDVITSEPSNPWQAGVCNLYTQEYFQVCHDRLKQGGIFTMWWQSNEVSHDNLARVFKALKNVFKHVLVFQTFPGDIAACASDEDIKIKLGKVSYALQSRNLRDHLSKYGGIAVPEDLPIKLIMSDEGVNKVIQNVEPNTDDRNHIEFDVSRTYEQMGYANENTKWFQDNSGKIWDAIDWGDMTKSQIANKMAGISERAMVLDSNLAEEWAQESYKIEKNSFALCVQALINAQRKANFEKAFELADRAVKEFPGDVRPICVRGIVELFAGAPLRARNDFESALKLEPNNAIYKFRLAQTYTPEIKEWYQIANLTLPDSGKADSQPQKVIDLLSPLISDSNFVVQNPTALGMLGNAYLEAQDTDEALQFMQAFLKIRRDDLQGMRLMAKIYQRRGDMQGADYCTAKANQLSKIIAAKLVSNAQSCINRHKEKAAAAAIRRAIEVDPANTDARTVLHKLARKSSEGRALMKELASSSFEDLEAYKELQSEEQK